MNYTIPSFKAFVKRSHLTKQPSSELDPCYVFGIQSLGGKVLTFHIMTDYGALRSRVPISEIVFGDGDYPVHFLQLWDCFSETAQVEVFDYLVGKRCEILLKDKNWVWATYMLTIDWFDNPYSEEPTDYKCGHLLKGDNGQLFLQPNNRLRWHDMNFVTRPFPINPKEFKVDSELVSVESFSDRWVSEDSDSYYYDMQEKCAKEFREAVSETVLSGSAFADIVITGQHKTELVKRQFRYMGLLRGSARLVNDILLKGYEVYDTNFILNFYSTTGIKHINEIEHEDWFKETWEEVI